MDSRDNEAENGLGKLDIQTGLIADALRQRGMDIGVARTRDDNGLDFLYQRGVILVRNDSLPEVRDILGPQPGDPDHARRRDPDAEDRPVEGITVYSLTDDAGTLETLAELDRQLGVGTTTPNHILSITPVYPCPATEPDDVPAEMPPYPGVCAGSGSGVSICVPDTGLLEGADAHPWLAGVTGEVDELPPPDSAGRVLIGEYTGHGTFIAGVARCMAPASSVFVSRDFTVAGALSEVELVQRLNGALGLGADIISLSAGGTTRHNLPLLSFEAFWGRYSRYKGVQLVAAAGNNSTSRPFWPAAFRDVVGVGALDASNRGRAYFSDFGSWVDVYAPGQDVVNAYATGTYVYREPPRIGQVREFYGMARWSGTSFATPLVAGLIAARMTRTGESARLAADALLAAARAQHIPGVGPVLLPCESGEHSRPAGCGCGCGCGGGSQPRCR